MSPYKRILLLLFWGILMIGMFPNASSQILPMAPAIEVSNVVILNDELVANETIQVEYELENVGNVTYTNFVVSFQVVTANRPGETTSNVLARQTISSLAAGEKLKQVIEFSSDAGTYVLQVVLIIDNIDVPTDSSVELQVSTAPVGDTQSLLSYLAIFLAGVIGLIFSHSFIDPIRVLLLKLTM